MLCMLMSDCITSVLEVAKVHPGLNGLILQAESRKFQQDDKLELVFLQRAVNRGLNKPWNSRVATQWDLRQQKQGVGNEDNIGL